MNKHFVFRDDSCWDNPPCDCCEGCLVDSYNCTSHPELYWTMGSYTEMYQSALVLVLGFEPDDFEAIEKSPYYSMEFEQIEAECKKLGITVEVQDDYSRRF